MKVVIAGSRRLPAGQAPRLLVRFLAALPEDALILLRRGVSTPPGQFEHDTQILCSILHLAWEWRVPEPSNETPGRASVYVRDVTMIEHADLVLLFFTPEDVEAGESGTCHLQDLALVIDRPVYAYALDEHGKVSRVGEYDPENAYLDRVPVVP